MSANSSSVYFVTLLHLNFDTSTHHLLIVHYVWKSVEPPAPSQTGSHLVSLDPTFHHDRCASGLCPGPTPSSSFSASSPGGGCFHQALSQTQDLPPTRLPPAAAALMNFNGASRLAPPYPSDLVHIATSPRTPISPSFIRPTVPSTLLLGGAHCLFRPGLLTLNLCSNPDQELICRGCYTVLSIVPEGFGKRRLYLKWGILLLIHDFIYSFGLDSWLSSRECHLHYFRPRLQRQTGFYSFNSHKTLS